MVERCNRIDDMVGANFLGILIKVRHPGFDAWADDERGTMKITFGELLEGRIERWHYASDNDTLGLERRAQTGALEQAREHNSVFVGCALGIGGDTPVMDQALAVINTDYNMSVAYVDSDQHRGASR